MTTGCTVPVVAAGCAVMTTGCTVKATTGCTVVTTVNVVATGCTTVPWPAVVLQFKPDLFLRDNRLYCDFMLDVLVVATDCTGVEVVCTVELVVP
jgi:hypothetical protein